MHSSFCQNLFTISAEPIGAFRRSSLLPVLSNDFYGLQTGNCSLNFMQLLTKLGFFSPDKSSPFEQRNKTFSSAIL